MWGGGGGEGRGYGGQIGITDKSLIISGTRSGRNFHILGGKGLFQL